MTVTFRILNFYVILESYGTEPYMEITTIILQYS